MFDSVTIIIVFALFVALGGLAFWIARQSLGVGEFKLFQSKPRRLGLVEITSVDGRRRLLLVRRDNVEHLIMTGGPVDVLIETGIPVVARAVNGHGEALSHAEAFAVHRPMGAADVPIMMQHDKPN